MLRLILITTAFLLSTMLPSHAQTVAQAAKLGEFLDLTNSELNATTTNLLQMAHGIESQRVESVESINVLGIFDAADNAARYFDKLEIVVAIYSLMVDSRDQAKVKKIGMLLSKQSVVASDNAISRINRNLINLRSPAAIAEAQKTRDLIQKIRDEIQRVFPPSREQLRG